MPVVWTWQDTEKRIIHFVFRDPWASDEFLAANDDANDAARGSNHKVDAIFDLTHVHSLPRNIITGTIDLVRHSDTQPHQGSAVIVGKHPGLKILMKVITQLATKDIVFHAEDLQGALAIVADLQARRTADTE
ncbi:MAG: hypothetical protein KC615_18320 [Anaerolineae bacterium]|nr:hypothetical protein [Anaerolineae bacterium]MCB9461504.1 hypothetical protein [Anaerolineaceae bacterium]